MLSLPFDASSSDLAAKLFFTNARRHQTIEFSLPGSVLLVSFAGGSASAITTVDLQWRRAFKEKNAAFEVSACVCSNEPARTTNGSILDQG